MPQVRAETDTLGEVYLPIETLYGANTWRGMNNLCFSGRTLADEPAFARAFAQCKMAAALANRDLGILQPDLAQAIVAACQEIIDGRHVEHLVVDLFEGSGGTSSNMNFNEVIANRAQQLLGMPLGKYDRVHPNDHVNRSQSTNDVYPSAMKIAVHARLAGVISELDALADAFAAKAAAFQEVLHLGRTCLQDGQPMYLGQVFGGYTALTRRLAEAVRTVRSQLIPLPLGATAIGTGLGSAPGYKRAVFAHLASITGVQFSVADDPFDAMQNMDAFSRVSAELRTAATSLGKVAADLILLSSGPNGGIAEIHLPAVQAGSSIMPGKVNPVIPMGVVQVGFAIVGNDTCVAQCIQAGQLEINHFEPAVLSRVFDSLTLLENGARLFREKCIVDLQADSAQGEAVVLNSAAIASSFLDQFGYNTVSAVVKKAARNNRSFLVEMQQQQLITIDDARELVRQAARVVPSEN
ncbi:aspartate ammonia-lyase [Bordetella sp. BOR01]|uniref:aspartate ammonia-lyase n=1 Tax=Bordetella sp. BOR01 TaxID=2854779 RepID=UPI001C44B840|nr:aspartate ammonia-lyase [Bordetella sp. BOR01]MBV7483839.1 aspartate ammonia-lyase [Bordetella sp. BOR01]